MKNIINEIPVILKKKKNCTPAAFKKNNHLLHLSEKLAG